MLSKSKILMAKDGVLLTWSNREKKRSVRQHGHFYLTR